MLLHVLPEGPAADNLDHPGHHVQAQAVAEPGTRLEVQRGLGQRRNDLRRGGVGIVPAHLLNGFNAQIVVEAAAHGQKMLHGDGVPGRGVPHPHGPEFRQQVPDGIGKLQLSRLHQLHGGHGGQGLGGRVEQVLILQRHRHRPRRVGEALRVGINRLVVPQHQAGAAGNTLGFPQGIQIRCQPIKIHK